MINWIRRIRQIDGKLYNFMIWINYFSRIWHEYIREIVCQRYQKTFILVIIYKYQHWSIFDDIGAIYIYERSITE